MTTTFASGCAWRAVYLYCGEPSISNPARLYVGVNPAAGRGPSLFGGYHFSPGNQWRFHVTLPHIRWVTAARWPWLLPLYRAQQRLLHRLDGRRAVRP